MFEKFQAAENRYDEINHRLSDPAVIANQDEYKKLMKEHAELEVLVTKYNEYKKLTKEIADAKEMLNEKLDKEFREMVETELKEAQESWKF